MEIIPLAPEHRLRQLSLLLSIVNVLHLNALGKEYLQYVRPDKIENPRKKIKKELQNTTHIYS